MNGDEVITDAERAYLFFIRVSFSYELNINLSHLHEGVRKSEPIFFSRLQSSSLNIIPLFLNVH
jgi:hypothetical protein